MKEKAIFISDYKNLEKLEKLLDMGWKTKLISPQVVSTATDGFTKYGGYLVILEKVDLDIL